MMKKLLSLFTALLLVLLLTACGGKKVTRSTEYDGKNSYDAILDYARRLEEMGDVEAAARLYDLLPQATSGPASNSEKDPTVSMIEEYKEADEFFSEFGR